MYTRVNRRMKIFASKNEVAWGSEIFAKFAQQWHISLFSVPEIASTFATALKFRSLKEKPRVLRAPDGLRRQLEHNSESC